MFQEAAVLKRGGNGGGYRDGNRNRSRDGRGGGDGRNRDRNRDGRNRDGNRDRNRDGNRDRNRDGGSRGRRGEGQGRLVLQMDAAKENIIAVHKQKRMPFVGILFISIMCILHNSYDRKGAVICL